MPRLCFRSCCKAGPPCRTDERRVDGWVRDGRTTIARAIKMATEAGIVLTWCCPRNTLSEANGEPPEHAYGNEQEEKHEPACVLGKAAVMFSTAGFPFAPANLRLDIGDDGHQRCHRRPSRMISDMVSRGGVHRRITTSGGRIASAASRIQLVSDVGLLASPMTAITNIQTAAPMAFMELSCIRHTAYAVPRNRAVPECTAVTAPACAQAHRQPSPDVPPSYFAGKCSRRRTGGPGWRCYQSYSSRYLR